MRTRITPPDLQEVEVVSTWKILVSISVMTTVSLLVLVLFSDTVDTGREVVNGLLEYAAAGASTSVFACMCVVALVLYVCDISYWSGTIGALARRIMLLLLKKWQIHQLMLVKEWLFLYKHYRKNLEICLFLLGQ